MADTIIHPYVAGVDLGSPRHLVAIDLNKDNVREFGVYTKGKQQMIRHLHQHGVTTIAMLRLMNIRLAVAFNDITGRAGMVVIEAILAGHPEADQLVSLVSDRVKKITPRDWRCLALFFSYVHFQNGWPVGCLTPLFTLIKKNSHAESYTAVKTLLAFTTV